MDLETEQKQPKQRKKKKERESVNSNFKPVDWENADTVTKNNNLGKKLILGEETKWKHLRYYW